MTDYTNNGTSDGTTATAAGNGKQYRSLVLTAFGGIRNVKVERKPEMTPKDGEVLIRVKICGVNFNDLMMRQGALDSVPKPPFTMGLECAGQVEAVGKDVTDFAIGDDVVTITDHSAWAELVATPSQYVYKMPIGMSYQDAASLLVNYVTAYLLLFDVGCLRNGQSVLMHSAGGGVGHAVSQLTQTMENVTLYGTASPEKHDVIKNKFSQIYDHVADYCQEIKKVSPEGVDLVLDSLCGEDTRKGISLLKPMGRYILYGNSSVVTGDTKSFLSFAKSWWQVDKVSPNDLYTDNKIVSGFNLRQLLFRQGQHDYIRSVVRKVFQLYTAGRIRPYIDSTWALEDVCEAMQKMHDRKNVGKILLDPFMEPKPKPEQTTSKPFNFSLSSIQNTIATSVTNKLNFSQSTDKEPVLEAKSDEEDIAPTQ